MVLRAIGLMSGTSLDGIDVAACDVDVAGERFDVATRHWTTVPIGDGLRSAVLASFPPAVGGADIVAALDVALGEAFADAVLRCVRDWQLDMSTVDVIGSHGQTIFHAGDAGATLQLGNAAVIAARTGVTCVGGFRHADLAAGGHGAPLVPYFDCRVFRHASEFRAALNIGGIANVTLLPPGEGLDGVTAFDTGPGNVAIDECVRLATDGKAAYDEDGRMAAAGQVDEALLAALLEDGYFGQAPPKSTGRERFGSAFAARAWERGRGRGLSAEDIVATVTALSAETIGASIPATAHRVIVSGGGVHNRSLLGGIEQRLRRRGCDAVVEPSDAHGISADAKEAIAFAVLAAMTLHGRTGNVPACTGAREGAVLGMIAPGRNYSTLTRKVWMGS